MNTHSLLEMSLLMWGRWQQPLREVLGRRAGEGELLPRAASTSPPQRPPFICSWVRKQHQVISAKTERGFGQPKGHANHGHSSAATLAPLPLLFLHLHPQLGPQGAPIAASSPQSHLPPHRSGAWGCDGTLSLETIASHTSLQPMAAPHHHCSEGHEGHLIQKQWLSLLW